ncbi:uroporphyrinogen-III synthase [Sciscionella sediminilitoris]|uniref:uroporphyrinogen-III synthase n=1 Tax=Sciscionella sediminilitoris TaxID=1445613 RepID=UPI0004DEE0D1|nr:uroporphyrinogen-III synthase [Sciscionella sp. SE31]
MKSLAGLRIGVTAARKAEEQIGMLERRGARVLRAPSVEYVRLDADPALRSATDRVLGLTAPTVVITTGMGLRGWLEAAGEWGLRAELTELLGSARILVRGPKAAGAVREIGLRERYTPESETDAELLAYLLAEGVDGAEIVLQSHGEPLPALTDPLRAAGARVTELLPYRWQVPEDTAPMRDLFELACSGELDAVTFTSAPAAQALIQVCGPAELAAALRGVLVACVGPVTAKPLLDRGIELAMPSRARTAALVNLVTEELGH